MSRRAGLACLLAVVSAIALAFGATGHDLFAVLGVLGLLVTIFVVLP